jgi:hypothetical protein
VLKIRFEHTGDLTDLDEATLLQRKAVEDVPSDHPRRPMIQANLAVVGDTGIEPVTPTVSKLQEEDLFL